MNDLQLQDLRKRANTFVEELEVEFGIAGDVRVSTQKLATKYELVIAVGGALNIKPAVPAGVHTTELTAEETSGDFITTKREGSEEESPQIELEFKPAPESTGEDDVEKELPVEVTSESEEAAPDGEVEQLDEKEPEPASKPKKRTTRKARPTKDELLTKMRDYVTSGGDRAGLKAYTKVTLGAANTDSLKVGDYAKVIAWIDANPVAEAE